MKKLVDKTRRKLRDSINLEIEPFFCRATRTTPEVILNPVTGVFRISGRAMPEDCRSFFQPILYWARDFAKIDGVQITLEFELEYFSSSSSIFLLRLMTQFNNMNKKGKSDVSFIWKYTLDDEALLEAGQEYAKIIGPSFFLAKSPD